jgi:hypothetical protein
MMNANSQSMIRKVFSGARCRHMMLMPAVVNNADRNSMSERADSAAAALAMTIAGDRS